METIVLAIIGLGALCTILYLMFRKTDSACDHCTNSCESCHLYQGNKDKRLERERHLKSSNPDDPDHD